jgi:hypothetical protein
VGALLPLESIPKPIVLFSFACGSASGQRSQARAAAERWLPVAQVWRKDRQWTRNTAELLPMQSSRCVPPPR